MEENNIILEGRKPLDPKNRQANVEFVLKHVNSELKPNQLTSQIFAVLNKYKKAITLYDKSLLDGIDTGSLKELKQVIDANSIPLDGTAAMSQAELQKIIDTDNVDKKTAVKKWKAMRDRYVKLLTQHGIELQQDAKHSLEELKKLLQANNIDATAREKRWKIHEKDVVKGSQEFLDSGLIHVNGVPVQEGWCKTQHIGGAVYSDVKVTNTKNKKHFFIECKLDFASSRYFKYVITIANGQLKYDHHKYLEGKKSSEELEKLDALFTKCIDLNGFIKSILMDPSVKASWEQFGSNVDELCYWLKDGDLLDGSADKEWLKAVAPFMMKTSSGINEAKKSAPTMQTMQDFIKPTLSFKVGNYPENFKDIARVFDRYIQYYIDGYNALLKHLFERIEQMPDIDLVDDDDGNKMSFDDFKIPPEKSDLSRSGDVKANKLVQLITKIQAHAGTYQAFADEINDEVRGTKLGIFHGDMDNAQDINAIANAIRKIEIKINAILESLGHQAGDYAALKSISEKDKLMHFFKLFISTTGRKRKGKRAVLLGDSDEEGNMNICQPVVVENTRLAQMITDFYVKKDRCAYIQIGNRVYLFDIRHNPLGLKDLPIFKECLTSFEVSFLISDELNRISLSVRAIEPDNSAFSGTDHVSFVPNDKNFICKVLKKPIEIEVKAKC